MPNSDQSLRVYEDLAQWYEGQGQAKLRDWFLVLAADTAQSAGRPDEAERLRERLLSVNPHHLLRPFGSFAEAVQSPDVQGYVADLRRTYPPAAAEQLLKSHRGPMIEAEDLGPRLTAAPAEAPASSPTAPANADVKVFRVQGDAEETRPAPPAPAPKIAAPAKPAARVPVAAPVRPPPAARAPRRAAVSAPAPDEDMTVNRGVSLVLFVVLLAGGLILAGYLLARPFLP